MQTKATEDLTLPSKGKGRGKWILPACALLLAGLAVISVCAILTVSFTLKGLSETQVVLGEPYQEKGGQASILGIDLSDRIRQDGTVDTNQPGVYTLSYTINGMGWIPPLQRKVTVVDITIPDLTLADGENLIVELNAPFTDPGYTAVDNHDGDLTRKVQVSGTVDTATPGEYTLTYTVSDKSGNEAKAARIVTVLPRSPLTMDLKEFTLDDYFADVILPKSQDAGEAYINDTTFIGDSITQNGLGFGFLPYHNVWAKPAIQPDTILTEPLVVYGGSDEGKDVEMTALEAAGKFKPKRVLINIGSNCVYKMKADEFASHYEKFLDAFVSKSPDTQIIICSIFPVDKRYDTSEKTAYTTNNDKCNKINVALAQLCRDKGYRFLNLAEALKDENGQAREGYFYESDGIHPNKTTYPLILDYIRTHPYPDGME